MAHDIHFAGIDAPLRLHGATDVLALLPEVANDWPFEIRKASFSNAPFFTISSENGSDRLLCETHLTDKDARRLDPLNALCDMVAALPLALANSDDGTICLHCAAIGIGGRLVVFPNIRRAGKSTLSAAMARTGHAIFSDDVLPVSFDKEGRAFGRAMGIAPRLRVPLPETIPKDFRAWVDDMPGPRNGQYKYLHVEGQPPSGSMSPIGAFVILDRQDEETSPVLEPVTADVAMNVLLHQNFTRDRHSADILTSIAAVLAEIPAFRLTFSDPMAAVDCLETASVDWPEPSSCTPALPLTRFRMAVVGTRAGARLVPEDVLRRREGSVARKIGAALYLSDPEGRAIHYMDPLAAAIWDLLEEDITLQELECLLSEAFADTPRDRIAADLNRLLTKLAKTGLVQAGRHD